LSGEWATGFGWVIINGVKFEHDVLVLPDGSVVRRRKELSSDLRGKFGHTPFSLKEFDALLHVSPCTPETLVIGSGQYDDLPVMKDVLEKAERLGIRVIIKRTPEALTILKELLSSDKCVAGVLHVTC